jgi:hypothetical protein
MRADLDPRDADLAARLRALGSRPVDPALQSEHLTAIAGVRTGSAFRSSLAGRLKVGAGVLAGFLLGATGLTAAGAMGPLQSISAKAVETVTPLEVTHGKSADAKAKHADDAKDDDETEGTESGPKVLEDGRSIGTLRDWKGCEDNDAGNRGQYLKAVREAGGDLAAAKASNCGMPLAAGDDETTTDEPKAADTNDDASDDAGKPADAGKPDEPGKSADHKPADAGKPDDAGKPATVPNAEATDHANDKADLPDHAPGEPAEGTGTSADA